MLAILFCFYTCNCGASPHFLLDQLLDYFVKFFSCYLLITLSLWGDLQGPVLLGANATVLLSTTPEKIVYLQWMKALNNDFVPWRDQNKLKLSLLNSFGSYESSTEHLQTFLAMFRTLQKIVRNLQSHWDILNFRIPSHDKMKISHIWLRKSRQV